MARTRYQKKIYGILFISTKDEDKIQEVKDNMETDIDLTVEMPISWSIEQKAQHIIKLCDKFNVYEVGFAVSDKVIQLVNEHYDSEEE